MKPGLLGLAPSFGFGDRIGLATPGHVAAMKTAGGCIVPIFAQQSARELARTGQTPEQVLGAAVSGAHSWTSAWGADADHLKTIGDIDRFAEAGFTFYTLDPSGSDDWVETIARLYKHLATKHIPFEVEIALDETDTPTTPDEHYRIANQLQARGVEWVSLAPRFVGKFEKGVDYIGNLSDLRANIVAHAQVVKALGPYKLSFHSGSDKFSIYPFIPDATRGLFHIKTSGTSYLEALYLVADQAPELFKAITDLARLSFTQQKQSYFVSDQETQILHVTFGPVLSQFGDEIRSTLERHAGNYRTRLKAHFLRHLRPLLTSKRE